ncbi:hypothetical protein METBIDRAFT_30543 [Metschnikowia bicuspidata var. bicuspidata NRRL YB-4993]|uniref:Cyclin-A N-terminal APC/C binding region domain-containing protein n=1 Tax=Metschnikowia bicuspidata var. bicuspidata NRRL YB-4993 TaxID=869754 RepID=A0A1A0HJP1_9ASCO|nr:hypothetical protein METBIDRAFT_30543 [Metschnikowia bicuspidata var. bicuspidata NRRL YB-4993]OBA24216.1 hypothetical protein METBIDRAFT_30543 [Metschnikowia bicuspidata var. bicuspidata NRRL YB-4993]
MSSPSRPLSPKRDSMLNSRSPSPLKNRPSTPAKAQAQTMRKLPKLGVNLTPRRKQESAGFQIYEDKPEEYELYHKSRASPSNDGVELHDDKENILQPKVLSLDQNLYTHRRPLANLDIRKFTGSAVTLGQVLRRPMQLTQLYQPTNYNNESKTTHKFSPLPSFVTPPRNAMRQILHRTHDSIAEEDDLELRLIAKLQDLARRKRAMSVGVNKGKEHLVQKPRFQVYTN